MDHGLLHRITRRGLARATGVVASAGMIAKLEQVELALAKDKGAQRTVTVAKHKKRKKRYKMLVYGTAGGPIYRELKKSYRMVKYTGKQDPGKFQGVLSDHNRISYEQFAGTPIFRQAYAKGTRLFFLNTKPRYMRDVIARDLGGIRSDPMPGFIIDRRRSGNNPRGQTVGTAWPITLGEDGRTGERSFRHAVADPTIHPDRFADAFDLWIDAASENPRRVTPQSVNASPVTASAPQWGTGYVGQTNQQPVTSVDVDAYGNVYLPIIGVGGIGQPACPGYDQDSYGPNNYCWRVDANWSISWDSPTTTWTSSPLTSSNPVVFIQSVVTGLWMDSTMDPPVQAPTLNNDSACATPPAPTGDAPLSMWVSSYMSGSPDGTDCLAGNSGNVNLCYTTDARYETPYCDSDTGRGQWGLGVRAVPALAGYNMFLGYDTTLTPSGGAPVFDFQGSYPCNEDTVQTLTSGSSHTQGFSIGTNIGYADHGGTATVNAGYEDEWEVDSSTSYSIPEWEFLTTAAGTAYTVPSQSGNYNIWGSFDGTATPPQYANNNYALTIDPTDLNNLQCGQNAVVGQSYYVGEANGQGSVDVTTTFTYWAGTTSQVVDLNLWDRPNASTQYPTTLLQTIAGGTYPMTFTLATDSRMINPVETPTTFSASWSDPVVVSPPNATQVLQSTLTVTPDSGVAAFDYTTSILLAVGLNTENPGALNDLVTLESITVGGAAVPGGAVGNPIQVSGGQTLEMTFNYITINDAPYFSTAYVTSSNPSESLSAAWAQVPISFQGSSNSSSRSRLKDRLPGKRNKR